MISMIGASSALPMRLQCLEERDGSENDDKDDDCHKKQHY